MCDFPSWEKCEDGTVLFLTDKEVGRLTAWAEGDLYGHAALKEVFPGQRGMLGEGFPCPAVVALAIRAGKMDKMMRAAGYVSVSVNTTGKLHRVDGPAVVRVNGDKAWYRAGKLHRVDGPAVVRANGDKEWWRADKLHRVDGPAIERANGDKAWYRAGKLHRVGGPAVVRVNGDKAWYRAGKLHRVDGPAVEGSTPSRRNGDEKEKA